MNQSKKIALVACKGLNSQILLCKLLENNEINIGLLIEVPIIPQSPKTRRAMSGTMHKIKRSPIKFLGFQLFVFHVAALLAMLLGKSPKSIAKRKGIPVIQKKIVDSEFLRLIFENNINLIVNSSALILTDEILRIPNAGTLNCHAAPLPEFRGPGNAFWMLAESSKKAYGTIHFVSLGVDSGPVIIQTIPRFIDPGTTLLELWINIRLDLSICLSQILEQYTKNSEIFSYAQDENKANQRSFPDQQALAQLKARGHHFANIKDLVVFTKCIFNRA